MQDKFARGPLWRPGRRRWLAAAGAMAASAAVPQAHLLAQQTRDFIVGPPVPDIEPTRLSERVWMIFSPDGFPTPENQGMMSNVTFVTTSQGVVVLDSGSSLQIGQMVIRMIRRVTDRPVVAVFNSHYHGDHWLGNHAFAQTWGSQLPIHALPGTIEAVRGTAGSSWRSLLERWTNQSTLGTEVVAPNTPVSHGQMLRWGDTSFRMHHYGTAHTPSDLCVEVVEDRVVHVGDIAMTNRIANMDDGSYPGTFKYYEALGQAVSQALWVPGHGQARRDLLETYGRFMAGIWEPCLKAVQEDKTEAQAKADVLQDPRVASRAAAMQGFQGNIGKYVSLAYLEAEKLAF